MSWSVDPAPPVQQAGPSWTTLPATPQPVHRSAWFARIHRNARVTGVGVLSAVAVPAYPLQRPQFHGSGTLSCTITIHNTRAAGLVGNGCLVGEAWRTQAVAAAFTGAGAVSAVFNDGLVAVVQLGAAASLTGAGSLSAIVSGGVTVYPDGLYATITTTGGTIAAAGALAGAGVLAADFGQVYALTSVEDSTGVLSADAFARYTGSAALAGGGVYTATATAVYSRAAALAGVGALSATATAFAAGTAPAALSGVGTLSATVHPHPVPVSYFDFLEGSGTTTASSDGLHTLHVSDAVKGWNSGAGALTFYAAGKVGDLSNAFPITFPITFGDELPEVRALPTWTFSMMVNIASGPTADFTLLSHPSAFFVNVLSDGRLRLYTTGLGTITSTATMSFNAWHRITVTSDGTTVREYVDGVQVLSVSGALPVDLINDTHVLENWTGGASPTAAVDSLAFYDATLIPSEVAALGVTPPLSGVGVLAAAATAVVVGAASAALSGGGTLSATATAVYSRAAALAGAGALTVTASQVYSPAVPLSGAGALSSTATALYDRAAALAGGGVLSATAVEAAGGVPAAAALTGDGVLSATATQVPIPTITNITTSPFRVGDTITLTGTGYTGTVTVTVGGTAATSVTVGSSTSLTCVIPSVALGARNVVVTAASGVSSAYSITLVASFTPITEENTVQTNATVPAGCSGVWVTLIGQGGGGGSGRNGNVGAANSGGGGGGGGACIPRTFIPVASLGATYSVVRSSSGPSGGANQTGTANGNIGGAGTAATFSSGSVSWSAGGGGGGAGGTSTTAAGGAGGTVSGTTGDAGGAGGTGQAGVTGSDGEDNGASNSGGGGGGGGGGVNASVRYGGGQGGDANGQTGGIGATAAGGAAGGGGALAAGVAQAGAGGGRGAISGQLGSGGGSSATSGGYGGGGGGGGGKQLTSTTPGGAAGISYSKLEWV